MLAFIDTRQRRDWVRWHFTIWLSLALLPALCLGCLGDHRGGRVDGAAPTSDAAIDVDEASPDAGADSSPVCRSGPEDTTVACSDGCSNDGDEFVDCDDRDCCSVAVGCPPSSWCGREGDGGMPPTCPSGAESTPTLCTDGCSNDGDMFIDCDDFDCCDAVTCPASSACGIGGPVTDYVSVTPSDCVGIGTVSYTFSPDRYDLATVAFATSTGYQVFGYTRGTVSSGPFPLTGITGERQVRVADLGSGLQMALSRWAGSEWTGSEGGDASFSDASTVNLARDAEVRYPTHACVGYLEGSATAGVFGGVDYMHFEFVAPVLGLEFPGLR